MHVKDIHESQRNSKCNLTMRAAPGVSPMLSGMPGGMYYGADCGGGASVLQQIGAVSTEVWENLLGYQADWEDHLKVQVVR